MICQATGTCWTWSLRNIRFLCLMKHLVLPHVSYTNMHLQCQQTRQSEENFDWTDIHYQVLHFTFRCFSTCCCLISQIRLAGCISWVYKSVYVFAKIWAWTACLNAPCWHNTMSLLTFSPALLSVGVTCQCLDIKWGRTSKIKRCAFISTFSLHRHIGY